MNGFYIVGEITPRIKGWGSCGGEGVRMVCCDQVAAGSLKEWSNAVEEYRRPATPSGVSEESAMEKERGVPTGMSDDALLAFNPIIHAAFERFAALASDQRTVGMMKQIVAAAIKAGVEPAKIFATIRTGRILTKENMRFLTKEDLEEWAAAMAEYEKLASKKSESGG